MVPYFNQRCSSLACGITPSFPGNTFRGDEVWLPCLRDSVGIFWVISPCWDGGEVFKYGFPYSILEPGAIALYAGRSWLP